MAWAEPAHKGALLAHTAAFAARTDHSRCLFAEEVADHSQAAGDSTVARTVVGWKGPMADYTLSHPFQNRKNKLDKCFSWSFTLISARMRIAI